MENIDRKRSRSLAQVLWAGFYRCPNNGRIIEALHNDDKALCGCQLPNPRVPTEYPGCHIIRFLESVSVDDYIEQRSADVRNRTAH